MRNVEKWTRGMPATGRAANHRLPGDDVLATGLADVILFVGSTTEPSPEQKSRPRINGDALHNPYPAGAPEFLGSAVGDTTPYTRRLRQARLRARQLVNANRRKDEFLAMLSHELRSPLAAIQTAVQLLSSQTLKTPARQRTQALIGRQVRRMTQLVDDLLDVSRISHGRLHLQRERIDLRVVVSNAIETLESDINERHHRLSTALPDAPVWLHRPCATSARITTSRTTARCEKSWAHARYGASGSSSPCVLRSVGALDCHAVGHCGLSRRNTLPDSQRQRASASSIP